MSSKVMMVVVAVIIITVDVVKVVAVDVDVVSVAVVDKLNVSVLMAEKQFGPPDTTSIESERELNMNSD